MKVVNFIKANYFNIFLVLLIIFFIYTGRFNTLKDRVEAFFGKDQGKLVSDLKFVDLKTNQLISLDNMKGKAVLVNFWATWCPPCQFEIPSLIELQEKYRDKGLIIVGLSLDKGSKENVIKFINDKKINYPVGLADSNNLKNFDEIVAVPTSFLINDKGIIEKRYSGYYLKAIFDKDIANILSIH